MKRVFELVEDRGTLVEVKTSNCHPEIETRALPKFYIEHYDYDDEHYC